MEEPLLYDSERMSFRLGLSIPELRHSLSVLGIRKRGGNQTGVPNRI